MKQMIMDRVRKITGDFSSRIGEILGFHALMPKRNSFELETPPPAYFFAPFYIDQKKSWSSAWENFSNLSQYSNWKPTIIKYHIGLLSKEHFELELSKSLKKLDKEMYDSEIKKMDSTLEVVSKFIFDPAATIDRKKLEKMTEEISVDLKALSDFQEKTLDELTRIEGEKSFLDAQKRISEKIITDLDKDYQYSVEFVQDGDIECPLCGTHHENSVIHRTSILTDKQQGENQLSQINSSLEQLNIKIENTRVKLSQTRSDIDVIHEKYVLEDGDKAIGLNEIIENVAGNSIKENVLTLKAKELLFSQTAALDIKKFNEYQIALLTDEKKKEINDNFIKTFSSYIELLGAEDINTSMVASPLDYSKIVKEGGAAESVRGILAYYLAIHTLIENSDNDVLAPMLIDTPNQQEQSISNYNKILELIKKKISPKSQIILCALKNEKLDILQENANIIHLTDKKLLSESRYEEIKKVFERYKLEEIEIQHKGTAN